MCWAYLASIAARFDRGVILRSSMLITSRVTPRQISQVGAIGSNTTDPSGLTALT